MPDMIVRIRPKFLYLTLLVFGLLLIGLRGSSSLYSSRRDPRRNKSGQSRQRARRFKITGELITDSEASLKAHLKYHGHKVHLYGAGQPSRGIVISAGGRRLLVNALVTIKVIREHFKSKLPIEVYYYGEAEADTTILHAMEELGVRAIDASLLPRPEVFEWPEELHGYAKKVFSLYSTGFKEVLMIDSDNQPLTRPEDLFDLREYKANGAVFWPDYWTAGAALEAPKDGIYQILGLPLPWRERSDWVCVESGQLLFNREVHAVALAWTLWLNLWWKVTYQYVLGDKDTFEIGFMLSGSHQSFVRIPTPPRAAFSAAQEGGLKHVGMVQSINGLPAFLHRTSGGKFDDQKAADQQSVVEYITEPMSVARAKKYVWHVTWAINVLPQKHVVSLPDCRHLDPVTVSALCKVSATASQWKHSKDRATAKRYCECAGKASSSSDLVPVLPLAIYGRSIEAAVHYSYTAFGEVMDLLESTKQD